MNWKTLILQIHKNIILNDIDNVNDGGCGFFAFFVANELEKLGIEYRIKVIDKVKLGGGSVKKKVTNINSFLLQKMPIKSDLISITHCWIQVKHKGQWLDFDGETSSFYPEWDYESEADFSGYFTKEELKVCLRYAKWNKLYKKSQNKLLRDSIREVFKNITSYESLHTTK